MPILTWQYFYAHQYTMTDGIRACPCYVFIIGIGAALDHEARFDSDRI
jgi:hypothetical protein